MKVGYRADSNQGLAMKDSVDQMIAKAIKGV